MASERIQRITVYRDALNERDYIVASDFGDPSEETVLSAHADYDQALRAAEDAAEHRGCEVVRDTMILL